MPLKKIVRRAVKKREGKKREELLDQRKEAKEAEETMKLFIEMGHPDIALKHTQRIVKAEVKARQLQAELTQGPKRLKYVTASRKARKRLKREKKAKAST
jgi:hypothetical protein